MPAAQANPTLMTSARAGWHIQIGAYTGEQEAQNKLQAARVKLGSMLSNVQSYTEKTLKGSAEYFRARFAGFHDEAEARKACDALKRSDFSCIPVKN
jgi:D-alanyl-D-alanine carboxypeptidase